MGAREALIIATGTYADEELRQLRSPAQDAEALARVLGDPSIGGFTVEQRVNETESVLRRSLFEFFSDRLRDDVLLLHVSCHGIKDDEGQLYFAATDTSRDALEVTAVPASFVNDQIERCRARSVVLLLDCCYAGAFASGSKGDSGVHLKETFSGHGRAILTASNALEYAWEGKELSGTPRPSVFTAAAVEGLSTGAADLNGDGRVSIHELHEFVAERMLAAVPKQTPLKWELGVEGGLYIARNPRPQPALPDIVLDALEHPLPGVRAGVVTDLSALLDSHDRRTAMEARAALDKLRHDDSASVRAAAAAALGAGMQPSGPSRAPAEVASNTSEQTDTAAGRPSPHPDRRALLTGAAAVALAAAVVAALTLLVRGPQDSAGPTPSPTAPSATPTATGTPAGASPTPTDPGSGTQELHVTVPATAPWTDTGIHLLPGDEVVVSASGQMMDDVTNPANVYTPEGVPDPAGEHAGDPYEANHAALVARVGSGGTVVEIGASGALVAAGGGPLQLGINDGRFDDNAGAYEARITVTPGDG